MPFSHFILQGLSRDDDHIAGIDQVFSLNPFEQGIVATAFMNAAGASVLSDMIGPIADRVDVFVGIRNGVTSMQALDILLQNGIHPFVVDTASQAYIFHPKVYAANNHQIGRILVGSANVTSGGMAKNIEASLYHEVNMFADPELVFSIYRQFAALRTEHPDNVFQISIDDFDRLVEENLLIDEMHASWSSSGKALSGDRLDERPRMRLKTRRIPKAQRVTHTPLQTEEIEGTNLIIEPITNLNLLWKSGALTRRDLNIPTGDGTNRTGSMLFKKGDPTQEIDQRFYFREEVFRDENWAPDPRPAYSHMERCNCQFRFVIKGIDYGVYTLRLSHNTRTDTVTFNQRNSMTQIHWGPALPLVAREDLLCAICRLYAPDENNIFTLVFDDE